MAVHTFSCPCLETLPVSSSELCTVLLSHYMLKLCLLWSNLALSSNCDKTFVILCFQTSWWFSNCCFPLF